MKRDNTKPKSLRAFIYARVSTREQREEGYSIEAQLKLLHKYAVEHGIEIIQEFTDAETAKETGRTNFGLMLKALQELPVDERVILVEKTDRLYRNIHDWVKVDDFRPVIHFVKDGYVLSADSRSNEKFIHGIKVLMAKNYVDNLSEEVKKGLEEKASQGVWPARPPLGYMTTPLNGKNIVVINPQTGPMLKVLFEQYATGMYSLDQLHEMATDLGLKSCHGSIISRPAIHAALHNLFYTGRFVWKGKEYQGSHEPLVSASLFQKTQEMLGGNVEKTAQHKRDFPFMGLLKCAQCGCAITAEEKKGMYVYYHCTGFRGKCEKPYINERELDKLMLGTVQAVCIGDDTALLIQQKLAEGHQAEQELSAAVVGEFQRRIDILKRKRSRLYDDKLDGRVAESFWAQKDAEYSAEMLELEARLEDAVGKGEPHYASVASIVELAQTASEAYSCAEPAEKRQLLKLLLSNCTWDGKNLHPDWKKPFSWFVELRAHPEMRGRRDSNSRSLA